MNKLTFPRSVLAGLASALLIASVGCTTAINETMTSSDTQRTDVQKQMSASNETEHEPTPWTRPFEVDAATYPFKSHVYSWNGLSYHYLDVPPADGTPYRGTVLAVHGNAVWSVIYRKIVEPLSEAGFRVIATDQFGYGFSDKPPSSEFSYMPSDHSRVLADFIRDLDLNDLYLVLQDWGGPIGLAAGVEEADRINGLMIMNTWAWRLDDIVDGETAYMHAVHDRGKHAAAQPELYLTGMLPNRGGIGLARRAAEQGTPEYLAVRDAIWGPYFELEEPYALLSELAAKPTQISAAATIADGDFLADLDNSLDELRQKPVYFAFGDDTAFGPYKVDRGFLGGPRKTCLEGYTPESEELTAKTNCLNSEGEPYWYPLERFLSGWSAEKVVGVWTDASVGHWVQDERPDVVIEAVRALHQAQP